MNETQVIKEALLAKGTCVPKPKRRVMMEIEPMPFEEKDEVINSIAKRRKKAKTRRIEDWTGTDFLKHIKYLSGLHSILYDSSLSSLRDRNEVSKIYDKIASHLQERMNNEVLRDYFEWWISSHSYLMSGRKIYISLFSYDTYINKFITRYDVSEKSAPNIVETRKEEEIDDVTLYTHGGLPMVIVSRGIVAAYGVLKQKNINNSFVKISSTLHDLSKDALQTTMDITIQNAPYPQQDVVDFISLARSAMVFHDLKQFMSLTYKDYFTGKPCQKE